MLWLVSWWGHAWLHSHYVCFTWVCMWSAIDEDGRHNQQPYWDYFKANNFTLGIVCFFTNISDSRGRPQLNQEKLFWKLPSPLSPEKLEEMLKLHNYDTRSAKLKPIKTNNNRGGRYLLVWDLWLSESYHGRPGRVAVGGGSIGLLWFGILPRLLGEAMLLGRKNWAGQHSY